MVLFRFIPCFPPPPPTILCYRVHYEMTIAPRLLAIDSQKRAPEISLNAILYIFISQDYYTIYTQHSTHSTYMYRLVRLEQPLFSISFQSLVSLAFSIPVVPVVSNSFQIRSLKMMASAVTPTKLDVNRCQDDPVTEW